MAQFAADRGTVFKLEKNGGGFRVLWNFTGDASDGDTPGTLIEGTDGVLYGSTRYGGSARAGAIFKLNKDGSGFALITSFATPITVRRLLEGSDGLLYGSGRPGFGGDVATLFKLGKDGSGYRLMWSFRSTDIEGYTSEALFQGSDGPLYGSSLRGGVLGQGTLFKLVIPPEISLVLTPTGARLQFAGQREREYEIQRATLIEGSWSNLATRVAPSTNTVIYTDTGPPDAVRFYRLRWVP